VFDKEPVEMFRKMLRNIPKTPKEGVRHFYTYTAQPSHTEQTIYLKVLFFYMYRGKCGHIFFFVGDVIQYGSSNTAIVMNTGLSPFVKWPLL